MDVQSVLNLPTQRLYDELIEAVLTNPVGLKDIVKELEAHARYTDDFVFRLHVQTAGLFIDVAIQNLENVKERADDLILRSSLAKLPQLLNLNYHILGVSYKLLEHYEQALECFFTVLKKEKVLPIKRLSSTVNYFIAEIYLMHFDYETSMKYIHAAFELLEATKEREPRYAFKKLSYTSLIVQILYDKKKYEEMYRYIEDIKEYTEGTGPNGVYTYNSSLIYYHLSKKNYEEAKKTLYKLLDYCGEDWDFKMQLTEGYLKILKKMDVDSSFYEKELFSSKNLPDSRFNYVNYSLNKFLYQYYIEKGDREGALVSLEKSYSYIEKEMEELYKRKVNSFKIVEKNASIEEDISNVLEKNQELKLITDEAVKNKELAETALLRLSLVNELGKQLTYSLDMEGIITTIYEKLNEKLPLECFLIMIKNPQKQQLESVIYYEHGKKQDGLIIDQNDKNSVFMETFNSKHSIKIDDFFQDRRYDHQQSRYEEEIFRSVLFIPLSVENKVIGVCSLQHSRPGIYTEEHLAFLEEILPYLSIALNNALKSETLESEIRQRERAQHKLQEVNRKLEVLSSLDGLTKISNRRDFEAKIMDLLKTSRRDKLPISIFMFDIDHFKLYNDNYGHLEGDEALKSIALIINKHFEKAEGISARFGGEEFIAACLNLSENECLELAEEIRKDILELKLENKMAPLGFLSISIGIAHTKALSKVRKSSLMRWADISLYNAKRTGKNKVVLKGLDSNEKAPEGLE